MAQQECEKNCRWPHHRIDMSGGLNEPIVAASAWKWAVTTHGSANVPVPTMPRSAVQADPDQAFRSIPISAACVSAPFNAFLISGLAPGVKHGGARPRDPASQMQVSARQPYLIQAGSLGAV